MLDSEQWSEGAQLDAFEERWAEWNGLPSLGLSSWAGGALAALEFAGVKGETVLCPSNTFMATPLAAIGAGAEVEFVDCNRERPLHVLRGLRAQGRAAQAARPRSSSTSAATSPSTPSGSPPTAATTGSSCSRTAPTPTAPTGTARRPGGFGDAGVYSLYATKTVSTGEGGVLVSANEELIEFAAQVPQLRQVRARGRRPQLPHERVHRRARPGPGRAHGGDRRLEERVRPRAPRPAAPGPAGAARGDDLGPLQVHRLRARSRSPPAASTTSPATASWAAPTSCPTPTGWPRTTGACRSTTAPRAARRPSARRSA